MPRVNVTQRPKTNEREAAICGRLRSIRLERGVQQKDAAKRLGVPLDTFRGYEYARSPLPFTAASRFCAEFDVNQRWLASGELPKKPYLELSPLVSQFIPDDAVFSRVVDSLLIDAIVEALEDIADCESEKCEIEEIDSWDHIPWTPILWASRVEKLDSFLPAIEQSVAHTFKILPPELIAPFDLALTDFLTDFRRKHSKKIENFLAEVRRDPTRDLREDEQFARSLVAKSLGIDIERLRHISMFPSPSRKR